MCSFRDSVKVEMEMTTNRRSSLHKHAVFHFLILVAVFCGIRKKEIAGVYLTEEKTQQWAEMAEMLIKT